MPRERTRGATIALLIIAFGALLLRLAFLLGRGGPLASPTDYDDGVYFSVSALLVRGVLPYRDFVFVHPPGVAWFYAILSWWHDPAVGFAAARVLACFAGAANTLLVGLIVLRSGNPFAAIIASLLYAIYPDAASVERSTYLEPVLNLGCLSSAWLWLSPDDAKPRRPFLAGFLAGAACTVKVLGGIWVVAAFASAPRGKPVQSIVRFIAGGALAASIFLAPLVLLAPSNFIDSVIRFQVSRPPDGTMGTALRLPLIFNAQPAAAILCALALIGIVVSAIRLRLSREERFFAIATLLTFASFIAASSYWTQYNSYLAASECVLAGLGAAWVLRVPRGRIAIGAVLAIGVMWLLLPSFARTLEAARQRSDDAIALHHAAARLDPAVSLFAFDPSWSLIAGRLPAHDDGAPIVVDSYAAMLMHASRSGQRGADTSETFRRATAQPDVRARLERSPALIVGWRGEWQMPDADRGWVRENFVCTTPEAGELCVRRRVAQPIASMVIAQGEVTFVDGWYGLEGTRAESWRWMGSRGVVTLPPARGTTQLQLEFFVPQESLAGQPSVTIALDGRVLETVRVTSGALVRTYRVPASGEPATLTITTDKTFVPAHSGNSADQRQLGLSLRRIIWLDTSGWTQLLKRNTGVPPAGSAASSPPSMRGLEARGPAG